MNDKNLRFKLNLFSMTGMKKEGFSCLAMGNNLC